LSAAAAAAGACRSKVRAPISAGIGASQGEAASAPVASASPAAQRSSMVRRLNS
jgi:hypothetical protein